MDKIIDTPCQKCGGDTGVTWIPSSGMDITSTGLRRDCKRCGFSQFIRSLDDKVREFLSINPHSGLK